MCLCSCTGIVLSPVVHYVRMPPRSETAASVEAAVVEKTLSHTDECLGFNAEKIISERIVSVFYHSFLSQGYESD